MQAQGGGAVPVLRTRARASAPGGGAGGEQISAPFAARTARFSRTISLWELPGCGLLPVGSLQSGRGSCLEVGC